MVWCFLSYNLNYNVQWIFDVQKWKKSLWFLLTSTYDLSFNAYRDIIKKKAWKEVSKISDTTSISGTWVMCHLLVWKMWLLFLLIFLFILSSYTAVHRWLEKLWTEMAPVKLLRSDWTFTLSYREMISYVHSMPGHTGEWEWASPFSHSSNICHGSAAFLPSFPLIF